MEYIYNDLKRILLEMRLANHQNVNDMVDIVNDEVVLTIESQAFTKKTFTKKIKKQLIKWHDDFRFKIIFNNKQSTVHYPTLFEKIVRVNYGIVYRNVIYRATALSSLFVIVMAVLYYLIELDKTLVENTANQLLDVSALISAFVVTYLTSKILSIRQEKINRIPKIKELSARLSDFRRICHVILNSWRFWEPSRVPYNHGRRVAERIDFNDLNYANRSSIRSNEIHDFMEYNRYGEILPKFVLQIATLCHSNIRSVQQSIFYGLDFAAKHIYSNKELGKIQFLPDNNLFWYVLDNERQDYENSFNFNIDNDSLQKIKKCAIRIDPANAEMVFNREFLVKLSQIAENEIIPELTVLVKKNEAKPSFLINYLLVSFTLIFVFGVLIKLILGMFISTILINYFSLVIVCSIVIHILLCMPSILAAEVKFKHKSDYD